MRGSALLDKMGFIDPAYVEAADAAPNRKKIAWGKWGAMAACFCLIAAGAWIVPRMRNTPAPPAPETSDAADPDPAVSVPDTPDHVQLEPIVIPELGGDGMGFEGYAFYDISELRNGNPWSEDLQITSLPVYRNGAYDASGMGIPRGLSEAEMQARLKSVIAALHLEVLSTEIMDDSGFVSTDAAPTEIQAETNQGTVSVRADGSIVYSLREGFALPDAYSFSEYDTSEEEAANVLSWLIASYRGLLGFQEPQAFTRGDYTYYGDFHRHYCAYDASGDNTEDLLNYHLRCAEFLPDGQGRLCGIRIADSLLSAEKVGDYPIITAREAKQRLLAGNYQTSVPAAFPGEAHIGAVELVYRAGSHEELLLPYYRFYVLHTDLADEIADGLKTYGAYYVPAIAAEYIANMPVCDGTFH